MPIKSCTQIKKQFIKNYPKFLTPIMYLSAIQQYKIILSDPFFWLLAFVFSFVFYAVYKSASRPKGQYNSEEWYLSAQLQYYNYHYISATSDNLSHLFGDIAHNPIRRFSYYTVVAQQPNMEPKTFSAKLEYAPNNVLLAIYWLPALKNN